MAENVPDDFVRVTFGKEIEKVIKDIETKATMVVGETSDGAHFQFSVRTVSDKTLVHLQHLPPGPRPLIDGEVIQMIFGLPDGLYMIRGPLTSERPGNHALALGSEIFKMQRRNNFRVGIPPGSKAHLAVLMYRNQQVGKNLSIGVLDLSAKGCRLDWNGVALGIPKIDDVVAGKLQLPGQRPLEVFARIRNVNPASLGASIGGALVGAEFQNLSQREEQTLIVACLQFSRAKATVL